MYPSGEHEPMHEKFHNLRDDEARCAPAFRTVMAAAERQTERCHRRLAPAAVLACAAMLACVVPLVLALPGAPDPAQKPRQDLEIRNAPTATLPPVVTTKETQAAPESDRSTTATNTQPNATRPTQARRQPKPDRPAQPQPTAPPTDCADC